MQVVHNALKKEVAPVKKPVKKAATQKAATWAKVASYKAYQKSLKKYAADIAEIQKHWPGWLPKHIK